MLESRKKLCNVPQWKFIRARVSVLARAVIIHIGNTARDLPNFCVRPAGYFMGKPSCLIDYLICLARKSKQLFSRTGFSRLEGTNVVLHQKVSDDTFGHLHVAKTPSA